MMLYDCFLGNQDAVSVFYSFQNTITLQDALKAENQISFYNKNTPATLEGALMFLILDLCNSFSGTFKITTQQAESICESIKAKYWYLRIEEIIYVFAKIKNGEFGEGYGGIDQSKIIRALQKYDIEERLNSIVTYKHEVTGKESEDDKIAIADIARQPENTRNTLSDDEIRELYTKALQYKNTKEKSNREPENSQKNDNNISDAVQFISMLQLDLSEAEIKSLSGIYESDYKEFVKQINNLNNENNKDNNEKESTIRNESYNECHYPIFEW